jgi:hypothetical protein
VAAAAPHRFVARRAPPAERVRRAVDRTEVRLDLDDRAGEPLAADHVHEPLTEQPARGRDGIGVEEQEARRRHGRRL